MSPVEAEDVSKQALSALSNVLAPNQIKSDPASVIAYDCDAYTIVKRPPLAITFPESTEQVASIVRVANQYNLPITPRGAGTGLSGGATAVNGGIVISTKKMNRILELSPADRTARVQAGVVNADVSKAAEPHGLQFAPDPSSQSVCTIGGNIAENSGGPHTLKHGTTAHHILGLTLVDNTGAIHQFGGPVLGGPGLDWLSVIVGSEGTVGIVTEALVQLVPLPKAVQTALISFPSVESATQTVSRVLELGVLPSALELIDHGILKALKIAFKFEYPPAAKAVLIVECDALGDDAEFEAQQELKRVIEIATRLGSLEVTVAENEAERAKLWQARKKGIGAMGRLAPSIVTHDGVIPPSKLPEMLKYVYEVAQKHNLGVANIFHAGDGNLHPCFYFDDRDPLQVEAVMAAGELIMRRCVELGGTLSGEHGIGIEKMMLMDLMFSPADLEFQKLPSVVFGSMNPCKILPNQKGCQEHQRPMIRTSGVAY